MDLINTSIITTVTERHQVVYHLVLNSIFGKAEDCTTVYTGKTHEEVEAFYKEHLAEAPYTELKTVQYYGGPSSVSYHKVFKKGSPLENYNATDLDKIDTFGHGIVKTISATPEMISATCTIDGQTFQCTGPNAMIHVERRIMIMLNSAP